MTRNRITLVCIVAATMSALAAAAVPNLFVAGQPASAAQVNQNFQYLDQRTNGAIGTLITTKFSASSEITTSVASVTCAPNSIVLSASCGCNNAGGTRNFGVLFGCNVAGNGGVVGCFNEAGTFNPGLPPPRGDISVVCLSGLQVDGTPLFAFPAAKASSDAGELERAERDLLDTERGHRSLGR